MDARNVKLKIDFEHPENSCVSVNGVEIPKNVVTYIRLDYHACELPCVVIGLIPTVIECDMDSSILLGCIEE